jgi:predicted ATPase
METALLSIRSISIKSPPNSTEFPFNLELIRQFGTLPIDHPITFFVGENGSGKSTVLEGIAAALKLPTIGAEESHVDPTLKSAQLLAKLITFGTKLKPPNGFYLRAEDFFNFTKRIASMKQESENRIQELEEEYKNRSEYAKKLAQGPEKTTIHALNARYGENLDANSHGESFLKVFQARFVPFSVYILDEPEAPLSPIRQLGMIKIISDMVDRGCQFFIATHSPILMATPRSVIWSFDSLPPKKVAYNELEHVKFTKDFLNQPEVYIKHLFDKEEDD